MKIDFRLMAFVTLGLPFGLLRAQQPNTPVPPAVQSLGTESGFATFQTKCMSCHGNPTMAGRVPDPATIRQLPPEKIYEALTTGPMKVQGQALSDEQKRMVAVFMSGRTFGSAQQ
ncbi:MAG: cytochrome c, partial [Bryobacterales bacterium]|nr:cytochrome c [Bryobacterales bacterium]